MECDLGNQMVLVAMEEVWEGHPDVQGLAMVIVP